MKLYDLIRKYQFEDVFKCLKKIDKRSHRKSYLSAWNELLILEPAIGKFGGGFIEVEEVIEEEGEDWINVTGFYPSQVGKPTAFGISYNGYYGLDFTDWQEWLGLEIKNLTNLSDIEVLANILWEMTYSGFTQEQIQEKRDRLIKIAKEINEDSIKKE